jgi:AcrR family transcriptional regulator
MKAKPVSGGPNAQDAPERILSAALCLFSAHGFDGVSIKEIAETAQVAPGLIYHYFKNKEDLLYSTIERYAFVPELCCCVEMPTELKIEDALLGAAKAVYRVFRQNEALLRVFFSQAVTNPTVNRRWLDVIRHGAAHLADLLRQHVETGELRPHDADVVARTLIHASSAFAITGIGEPALETLVSVVLDGIRAGDPNPKPQKSKKPRVRRSKP